MFLESRAAFVRFVVLGLAAGSVAIACSLNPQPIPPGAQPNADGGSSLGAGGETANPNDRTGASVDASTTSTSDASTPATPIPDAGPTTTVSDSGDAASEADADAGDGAVADAGADAPDDGAVKD